MHDERLKITHENGPPTLMRCGIPPMFNKNAKKKALGAFVRDALFGAISNISFLWPPDRYFWLNLQSKARWAKEKVHQYVRSKTSGNSINPISNPQSMPENLAERMEQAALKPAHERPNMVLTSPAQHPSADTGKMGMTVKPLPIR